MNFKTLNKLNYFQINIKAIDNHNSSYESHFVCSQSDNYKNIFQDDLLPCISHLTNEIKIIKEIFTKKYNFKCNYCNDNFQLKKFEYIIPKISFLDKVECFSEMKDELNELANYFRRCLFRYSIWNELNDISKVDEIEFYLNSKLNSKFVIYLGSGLEHIN
jgi:hypothetical protein